MGLDWPFVEGKDDGGVGGGGEVLDPEVGLVLLNNKILARDMHASCLLYRQSLRICNKRNILTA